MMLERVEMARVPMFVGFQSTLIQKLSLGIVTQNTPLRDRERLSAEWQGQGGTLNFTFSSLKGVQLHQEHECGFGFKIGILEVKIVPSVGNRYGFILGFAFTVVHDESRTGRGVLPVEGLPVGLFGLGDQALVGMRSGNLNIL